MSEHFDARDGAVIIGVELWGPVNRVALHLAVDTGATNTLISAVRLTYVGYDVGRCADSVWVTTGSGLTSMPRLSVLRLEALGQERTQFPVLAHTLPPTAAVDGLLGLDYFREQCLTVDFRNGLITLE